MPTAESTIASGRKYGPHRPQFFVSLFVAHDQHDLAKVNS